MTPAQEANILRRKADVLDMISLIPSHDSGYKEMLKMEYPVPYCNDISEAIRKEMAIATIFMFDEIKKKAIENLKEELEAINKVIADAKNG